MRSLCTDLEKSKRKPTKASVEKKCSKMAWALLQDVYAANAKGDTLNRDHLMIQLAYVTDAEWYLASLASKNEVVPS